MPTPHNEAKKEDIAQTVIMPGDPLRAKYIAENFLTDAKLVNSIRNMYAYTGLYKGKRITVMSHGMGIPSMSIYAYELYKFYDVQNIIRIGSCGAYSAELKLFDIILSEQSYSEGNFALTFNNDNCHIAKSSNSLNSIIESTANDMNTPLIKGSTACTDCFDLYMVGGTEQYLSRIPDDIKICAAEMESFALFYIANFFGKRASALLSVVNSASDANGEEATAEERETGLNSMIKLALESTLKI